MTSQSSYTGYLSVAYIWTVIRESLCRSALKRLRTSHLPLLMSFHSMLLEAHFTVSGNKMTITNKILTNQRRPYR